LVTVQIDGIIGVDYELELLVAMQKFDAQVMFFF